MKNCSHPKGYVRAYSVGRDLLFSDSVDKSYILKFSVVQCTLCFKVFWAGYLRNDDVMEFESPLKSNLQKEKQKQIVSELPNETKASKRKKELKAPVKNQEKIESINIGGRRWDSL